MSDGRVLLVRGDDLPRVVVDIAYEDGFPADLVGLSGAVMHFKEFGSNTVLSTVTCDLDVVGSSVSFDFSGGVLDVPAGEYRGEIELTINGLKQTLYNMLKFKVRE